MLLLLEGTLIRRRRYWIRLFDVHVPPRMKVMGIAWGAKPITFILGGTWTSNSLIQYLRRLINVPSSSNNMIYGTMGLTELGLNIFFQAPDLIEIQDQIQHRPQL